MIWTFVQLNVLARTNFAKVYIILAPSLLERLDSPSGSVFSEFSTFSTDAVGVGGIGNFSDVDDLIDDAAEMSSMSSSSTGESPRIWSNTANVYVADLKKLRSRSRTVRAVETF